MRNKEIKRLIINLPPRSLKSVCVSVAWPAWILGQDPAKRVMVASYSQVLSIKHSLDCKLVIASDWYKHIFPKTALSPKHNQKSKFLTTDNGFRFATSVGGSATGEGGDFLIVDDPHNPTYIHSSKIRNKTIDWFEQTFTTRLNNKNEGAIVIVMQRLHTEDLCGHLLANNSGWEHVIIPIIANSDRIFDIRGKEYSFKQGEVLHKERDSNDTLHRLEKEVGMHNYAAQYLQEPLIGNSILNRENISFYEKLPEKFEYFIQSWDTAIKISDESDYSVCSSWGVCDNKFYLTHLFRQKLFYPDLKNQVKAMAQKYQPRLILIEDKATGQSLIPDLRREGLAHIVAIKPKFDKVTRFAAVVELFESGRVLLPKQSSFNLSLIQELTTFPNSKNDDIIDSISQFLSFMKTYTHNQQKRIRVL